MSYKIFFPDGNLQPEQITTSVSNQLLLVFIFIKGKTGIKKIS